MTMTDTEQTEQGGGWMHEVAKSFAPLVAQAVFAEPVRKLSIVLPMTPELLADSEEDREGEALMVRLLSGTATPEEKAEAEARQAAHQVERGAAHAAAVAEWEQLRARYADSPAVLAVLDIHQPTDDGSLECQHPVSGWEADDEAWPCSTYEAIRDAVS